MESISIGRGMQKRWEKPLGEDGRTGHRKDRTSHSGKVGRPGLVLGYHSAGHPRYPFVPRVRLAFFSPPSASWTIRCRPTGSFRLLVVMRAESVRVRHL